MITPKDNLCNSCTNIGCEFQSGIVRTECAFYMPPRIECDNCGNYVVMLDKIRAEIDTARFINKDTKLCKNALASGLEVAMQIIDKYRERSKE